MATCMKTALAAPFACALALCADGTPSVPPGERVLPMASRALPFVAATVNGVHETLCLVDTGCTVTVAVRDVAKGWGIPLTPLGKPSSSFGFSGGIAVTHEMDLDALRLGTWEAGKLRAQAADLGPEPMGLGILVGQDLLRARCALFDAERREIRLLEAGADVAARLREIRPDRSWTRLPIAWESGVPVVTLSLKEKPLRMVLDTGANATAIHARVAARERLSRAGETGGAGGAPMGIYELPGLRIGPWDCAALAIGNPRLFTDGILGFDLLGRFPFAVDGKGDALWVAGPGKEPGETGTIQESYEDPVVRYLSDPFPRMRALRLEGLAGGGDRFFLPLAAELLSDPDPAVARAAAAACQGLLGLRWKGDPLAAARAWWKASWREELAAQSRAHPDDRRIAAAAIGKLSRRPLAPFAAIWLSDPDPAVRAAAAESLSRLSGERWPAGERGVEAARLWWKPRAEDPAFQPGR